MNRSKWGPAGRHCLERNVIHKRAEPSRVSVKSETVINMSKSDLATGSESSRLPFTCSSFEQRYLRTWGRLWGQPSEGVPACLPRFSSTNAPGRHACPLS